MSKFDPPKPQALTPAELVQAISRFGADAAGVSKAVELIQIQEQLKAQDESDMSSWVATMLADGSDRAIAALRSAGFDENGVFFGEDIAPADIAEPLPESEVRVENKRVVLETGLEGQFLNSDGQGETLTRYGKPLSTPAAALETANADRATYFQPKTQFTDEIPVLSAGLGLSAAFGFSLQGSTDSFGLVIGFLIGSLLAFGLTRFGGGFPGIFALTTFGVVGARFLRGLLSAAAIMALLALAPAALNPARELDVVPEAGLFVWGGMLLIAIAIGLAISGKPSLPIRLVLSATLLLGVLTIGLLSSVTTELRIQNLSFVALLAGGVIGFLLNSSLAFSTTVGGVRFHLLGAIVTSTVFGLFALILATGSETPIIYILLLLIAFSVALTFTASSTSKGRFWSGIAGAFAGLSAVLALTLLPESEVFTLAFMAALLGAWLGMISFDSVARKGRLHLASLNRSYGFYGPVSWLGILVLVFSGLLGGSLALFSPLSQAVPGVVGAGVVSYLLAGVFSLIRLPEIRAQEEEILLAVSRVSAGNQVGIGA